LMSITRYRQNRKNVAATPILSQKSPSANSAPAFGWSRERAEATEPQSIGRPEAPRASGCLPPPCRPRGRPAGHSRPRPRNDQADPAGQGYHAGAEGSRRHPDASRDRQLGAGPVRLALGCVGLEGSRQQPACPPERWLQAAQSIRPARGIRNYASHHGSPLASASRRRTLFPHGGRCATPFKKSRIQDSWP
jgi:hypothetical protein